MEEELSYYPDFFFMNQLHVGAASKSGAEVKPINHTANNIFTARLCIGEGLCCMLSRVCTLAASRFDQGLQVLVTKTTSLTVEPRLVRVINISHTTFWCANTPTCLFVDLTFAFG